MPDNKDLEDYFNKIEVELNEQMKDHSDSESERSDKTKRSAPYSSKLFRTGIGSRRRIPEHEGDIYNEDTVKISVENESDFTDGFAVFMIHALREQAKQEDAKYQVREDWKIFSNWLDFDGDEFSSDDQLKIIKAWRTYILSREAPTNKLKENFESLRKDSSTWGWELSDTPQEILDIFDRQLSSQKDKAQGETIKNDPPKSSVKKNSKKRRKTLIALFIAWSLWVMFRTYSDYHLIGIYLSDWDSDMFFLNWLLPPSIIILILLSIKWINK